MRNHLLIAKHRAGAVLWPRAKPALNTNRRWRFGCRCWPPDQPAYDYGPWSTSCLAIIHHQPQLIVTHTKLPHNADGVWCSFLSIRPIDGEMSNQPRGVNTLQSTRRITIVPSSDGYLNLRKTYSDYNYIYIIFKPSIHSMNTESAGCIVYFPIVLHQMHWIF